ncbi:MAG: DUF2065 domain-containing protein [Escherichia coli]|nr:DUF2065 domain-containing protein [Escherichia coli]
MNSTIWLALALVLVLEGLGPMLYPKAWKKMISAMTNLPDNILRRFGGGLKAMVESIFKQTVILKNG